MVLLQPGAGLGRGGDGAFGGGDEGDEEGWEREKEKRACASWP